MHKIKKLYKGLLGNDLVAHFIALTIYIYLNFVYFTSKKQFSYEERSSFDYHQNQNAIYLFWHNRLALMFFLKPKNIDVNVLISTHRDGKIIANTGKLFNLNIIEGSSSRNKISITKSIEESIKKGESVAITPDGPRGPVYTIKSNIAKIASKISAPIIPVSYHTTRAKIFRSWDKFILPLPFGRIKFIFGNPIILKEKLHSKDKDAFNVYLKKELDYVTSKSEIHN